jgi:hypothetical protein
MKLSTLVLQDDPVFVKDNFGIYDAKGREIGAIYTIGQCKFVEYDPVLHGYGASRTIEPGKYFFTNAQATRDGRAYGARQSSKFFKTIEEAQREIARYLAAAKLYALKKHAKVAA